MELITRNLLSLLLIGAMNVIQSSHLGLNDVPIQSEDV